MNIDDTIVALASPAGPAARAVVRMSGPQAIAIAARVSSDIAVGVSRQTLRFASLAVPGWIYSFRAPHSYTGQDAVEFHLPGNLVLVRMLMDDLIRFGARPAEAGEFTARAFLSGRLSLDAAEGVAATVAAGGAAEANAARQLMAGELARRLQPILDSLANTLALLEVGIDFSEEDVTVLDPAERRGRLTRCDVELADLLAVTGRFSLLRHEPTVVLAGRSNAGKSTLFNALLGQHRAVVSDVAGTTRDVLIEPLMLPGGTVLLCDVAGLDPAAEMTGTSAEQAIARQMRQHAGRAIAAAEVLLHVVASNDSEPPTIYFPVQPDLLIRSKSDQSKKADDAAALSVSAHTGDGLGLLLKAINALAFPQTEAPAEGASMIALNARHVAALSEARASLARALHADAAELVAADVREAVDQIGSVVGILTPDDILGKIFAGFCIGK